MTTSQTETSRDGDGPAAPGTGTGAARGRSRIRAVTDVPEFGVIAACVLVFAIVTVIQPRFADAANLRVIGLDLADYGILAIGVGIVILTSGIDLSPGSIVALCSMVSAYLNVNDNIPVGLCIVISIAIGAVIGYLHGWFVTRLDVPPFAITLVTLTAAAGGALALTPDGLDPEHCLIHLREKGSTERWQPVSPTLMTHLLAHAETRGGLDSSQRLLRYPTGKPITGRRYDHLWDRIGRELSWVRTQGISTHWIRHTTLTWVERNFGFATAHAYAGHMDGRSDTVSVTSTYVRATLAEVATALSALTGEPHPLALPGGGQYDSAG